MCQMLRMFCILFHLAKLIKGDKCLSIDSCNRSWRPFLKVSTSSAAGNILFTGYFDKTAHELSSQSLHCPLRIKVQYGTIDWFDKTWSTGNDRVDSAHSIKKINSIDRYCLDPFPWRVDCVDQLAVARIDRYDRRGLLRATIDCVDQLSVERSDRYDRRGLLRARSTVNVLFIAPTSGNHSAK